MFCGTYICGSFSGMPISKNEFTVNTLITKYKRTSLQLILEYRKNNTARYISLKI